jgi:uncharacterized protein YbjT (DUF2867 family)
VQLERQVGQFFESSLKGKSVKALVFHPEQIQEVEALGATEVIVGDMRKASLVYKAIQNVDSVYHICPNMHPDEIRIGQTMIDAATTAGIAHFVYHSVLHPQIEAMPHHWKKMRVEEKILESGLPFTILQPAVYMQNILLYWQTIIEKGKYLVPYSTESRISLVDLEDVALAATRVLTEVLLAENRPFHLGATYELVGTPAMSQNEVAAIISQQLGRSLIAENISRDAWKRQAKSSGLGYYQVKTLSAMFEYYENHGLWGNPQVLSWLINRPSTSLEAFVSRIIEDHLH